MPITAIVPPSLEPRGPTERGSRQFYAVDEFVSAVGAALGEPLTILETTLSAAPTEGSLLVFGDTDLSAHKDACPRMVLINADRSTVAKKLEKFALAGAIEKHRYFQWKTQRSNEDGSGVIGLKELASLLGAAIEEGPYTTVTYGWLSSPSAPDLPSLLADYLKAYEVFQRR